MLVVNTAIATDQPGNADTPTLGRIQPTAGLLIYKTFISLLREFHEHKQCECFQSMFSGTKLN